LGWNLAVRLYPALALLLAVCLSARAQPYTGWSLARTAHFEVYSQAGAPTARSTVLWLEQLRALFVQQTGLTPGNAAPVRVIAFRSDNDYQPYRLRVASDAYCVGGEVRDYIVMPSAGVEEFRVAAHEYAHSLLHSSRLHFPPWLSEGLAEFFSTVRIGERGSSIGGDLPARSQTLRRMPWMPLAQLLAVTGEGAPVFYAPVFYAQSWALTGMLMLSPEYAPGFARLAAALASGQPGVQALPAVYGRPLEAMGRDLLAWSGGRRFRAIPLPGIAAGAVRVEVSPVSEFQSRSLMAELLAAIGEWDRAETQYRDLAREAPFDAGPPAALGTIALQRGDRDGARREWKRALDLGVTDAALCYRYATLASLTGLPADDVRPAYQRAIELQPDYDDARYSLALLEKNAEEYEAALAQLRAMRNVSPARLYHYWFAMADALTLLGRREEAVSAARKAAEHAASPEERARASTLAYMAQTDLGVRLVRDASGRNRLVTTRVPHDTVDWNPFIEPGDDVRKVQGTLREIDCGSAVTRLMVETAGGPVTLAIPDLSHLQARNAPAEFTCGPQEGSAVTVVYAAGKVESTKSDGVLRGIEFR